MARVWNAAAPETPPPVIRATGITRRFGGRTALGPIDLELRPAEFLSLLGPSGCGKSTLLRLLGGLDKPDAGTIAFGSTTAAPRIATVFQEPRLMPWLSVADNIGLALWSVPARERMPRIDRALARVGLSAHARALPKTLSGGMAQRAGVARALATDPDILLMDEPFGALDPLTRLSLQGHLQEILAGGGISVVFVTHDVEEALLLSDRVIVLAGSPGRVARELTLGIPRPRTRHDAEIVRLREELLAMLGVEQARDMTPATFEI